MRPRGSLGILSAMVLAGSMAMVPGLTVVEARPAKRREPEPRPEIADLPPTPANRMPHQGNRERERRRKQLANAAAKAEAHQP